MSTDGALRDHLVRLLTTPWAHVTAGAALSDVPAEHRGARAPGHAHTIWQLLEHLRICQEDLIEYSRDPNHVSPDFPDGLWPEEDAPQSARAWDESVAAFTAGLDRMASLVSDPAQDLFEPFPWSEEGHTLLREVLILADHNAYHVGQIMQLRRALAGSGGS